MAQTFKRVVTLTPTIVLIVSAYWLAMVATFALGASQVAP